MTRRYARRYAQAGLQTTLALLIALGSAHVAQADDLALPGKQLFAEYCASCHGPQALGNGPVAAFMTVKVPNLTLIAARNDGKFPADKVEQIIDGRAIIGAHGSREMPIWGERFMRKELGNPDAQRATTLLVKRLTEYVQSIQRSPNSSN